MRQRAKLLAEVDPVKALEEQLATLSAKMNAELKATGGLVASQDTLAQMRAISVQIASARGAEQRRAQRPVRIDHFVNLARRPVEATFHPGGVVELAEPSGWL